MQMNQLFKKTKKPVSEETVKPYGQKEVDFSAILPMPEGYERLFLVLYFVTIPYVIGAIFLFLFVAKGSISTFLTMDIAMFVAVWAIGYEIVGSVALIVIFYKMFRYNQALKRMQSQPQTSVRAKRNSDLYKVHEFS